jgi:hypothetical protein
MSTATIGDVITGCIFCLHRFQELWSSGHSFQSTKFQDLAAMETGADKTVPCGDVPDGDVLPNKRLLR